MKTYDCTLSTGKKVGIQAMSAADAIQTALLRHPDCTVSRCRWGQEGGPGIEYDVPPHKALTREQIDATKPEKKPSKRQEATPPPVYAPWIEEWMKRKSPTP